MFKVTGAMQKSTEIMKISNQLVKLPEISKVMREMSMEMTKVSEPLGAPAHQLLTLPPRQAGIMEEILEETLDSGVLGEDEGLEEEADGEVDKVLFELTDGKLGQAASAGALPDLAGPEPVRAPQDAESEREDMERMQLALQGLLRE